MEPRTLLEWVNRADLFRIASVSDAHAHLLESAGVDTIKELATRNAAGLAAKLKEVGGDAAPDEATVSSGVESAKAMPLLVSH